MILTFASPFALRWWQVLPTRVLGRLAALSGQRLGKISQIDTSNNFLSEASQLLFSSGRIFSLACINVDHDGFQS
ncbi:MAG: hypothetical protein MG2_0054 [uncultured Candidatus Poseidoniales archaeon]|nr:MAG: hypothetical protein MG2_0054 [uncultured Candidatus Poseidoniales archaeon]